MSMPDPAIQQQLHHFYRDHHGWLKAWLRKKLGEAPVFVSDVNLALNTENIEAYLANHGHFNSKATGDE